MTIHRRCAFGRPSARTGSGNREIEEDWYADSGALTDSDPSETIHYDYNLSQLTAAYDNASGYTYSYDAIGRLDETDNLGGQTNGTADVPDVLLAYSYDADGSRQTLSATIGATGGVGGTQDFLNTYGYDSDEWLISISQQGQDGNTVADKLATFQYDAAGDTTGVGRYDATTETSLVASSQFAFDADDRLTNLTQTAADGTTTYAAYAWSYTGADEVGSFANADYSAEDIGTYSYDADGQLTGATSGSDATVLANSYDGNGNPTNSGDVTGAGNRLLSDGIWDYSYDANGNLTKQVGANGGPQAGNEIDYAYDIANQLTDVTSYTDGVPTQHVGYQYDLYGNLIGRSITPYIGGVEQATTTSRMVFDPATGQMVLAFDGSGNLTDRFLNGTAVDEILADENYSSPTANPSTAGDTEWLLGDNQGTVRDIVDSSGLLDHLSYGPFGDLTGQSGTGAIAATDVIFGEYTGSFYDSATGLQWDGARMYKPSIERWLQQDPSGLGPDSNPYRYADNSPTNLSDPSGLARFGAAIMVDGGGGTETSASGRGGHMAVANGTLEWTLFQGANDTAEFHIKFTPEKGTCTCKHISFVQVVLQGTTGGAHNYPHPNGRLATAAEKKYWDQLMTQQGAWVDHAPGETDPFYGAMWGRMNPNDKSATWIAEPGCNVGNGPLGSFAETSDGPNARLEGRKGNGDNVSRYEVYAVCIDTGEILGGVEWGYIVPDAPGSAKLLTGGGQAEFRDIPSDEWSNALDAWNKFAGNKSNSNTYWTFTPGVGAK